MDVGLRVMLLVGESHGQADVLGLCVDAAQFCPQLRLVGPRLLQCLPDRAQVRMPEAHA